LVDISLTVSPVRDGQGNIVGASKVARDMTGPKRARDQKDLLLFEMKHRIKNTLATIQAVANQTLRSVSAAERLAFAGRLHSLGSAYDLLTAEKWDRAPVIDVVRTALHPFHENHRARFLIEVPAISSSILKSLRWKERGSPRCGSTTRSPSSGPGRRTPQEQSTPAHLDRAHTHPASLQIGLA
jgi:hypothetical protein